MLHASAEMPGEKLSGSAVCQLRGVLGSALAEFGGETVIEPFIIVQRDLRVVVQAFMHGLLRILVDETVLCGNVQHERIRDCMLFTEKAVDTDAIIADTCIDIGAGGGHESETASQAVTNATNLGNAFLTPDVMDGGFDIPNSLILIEPAHQIERALKFWFDIGIELDSRF